MGNDCSQGKLDFLFIVLGMVLSEKKTQNLSFLLLLVVCNLDCGAHGRCEAGKCKCDEGWTGNRCELLPCDPRCHEHGQCRNGTCVCSQGWNGRHCTLRK